MSGVPLAAAAAAKKVAAKADAERLRAAARATLLAICQTKCRTSFVGALAAFEAAFGALWGHGKPPSECTPEELGWRAVWEQCRGDVLTKGNAQLRALTKEFERYEVTWVGERAVFRVVTPQPPEDQDRDG